MVSITMRKEPFHKEMRGIRESIDACRKATSDLIHIKILPFKKGLSIAIKEIKMHLH